MNNKLPLIYYHELDRFTKLWKKSNEFYFLKLSPVQTLQQTLKQLQRAFKDAFDKKHPLKRIPVVKKRHCSNSFTLPQGFKTKGKRIFLPKIGWINFRKSREIMGTPKNVTVSKTGKHWFVLIQVEQEINKPVHLSTSIAGGDLGVKWLLTLSSGEHFKPINTDKESLQNNLR